MSLDHDTLPRDFHRRFLTDSVNPADWNQLEGFFRELQERSIGSVADLRSWLEDYSELFTAISEAGSIRYIRMTEQTDRKEYHDAYAAFVEKVEPRVKVAQFDLNRRFVQSEHRSLLPREEYGLLERKIRNSVTIFRESNVDLEKEDRKLVQEHLSVTGAMTVFYDGRERTIPEMAKYLESTDVSKREESWKVTRIAKDRDRLEDIFDRMVGIRDRIARNAGYANFRDYSFVSRERFDYNPADCFRFHDAVEKHIVPLVREVYRKRQRELGLESFRPWDELADPERRPPLSPFKTTSELVDGCECVFGLVNPDFSEEFRMMSKLKLLDLESRPGKAPGGYNTELLEVRLPFIFMNSAGRDDDLRTLMHESGHAFHIFEMRDQALHYLYRSDNTPVEIAEVASMSMELLGGEHVSGVFYDEADAAARSRYERFLAIARLFPWIATIDAFQHWPYTNPQHTREERGDAWMKTYDRFGTGLNWKGLEEEKRYAWHRQGHIFQTPFYCIEYGITQLGALGVWSRYLHNPREAVRLYREALALGGSKPLLQLFSKAGLPWGFREEVVEAYSKEVRRILLP